MKTILVATPSTSLADSIEFELRQKHYQIELAKEGQSALQQVLDKKIDLLICCLNLPLLDGLSLCELLRNHSQSRFIPVILLVDELFGEQEIQERGITINSYLTIPFDMHKLLFKVNKLLSCD